MKKLLCLLALGWLVGLVAPVLAAQEHVALVKHVSGSVKVTRQSATLDAAGGMQLQVADRLVAAPGATAAIVFKDGTLLTLGGGADVLVRDYVFEPKAGKYAFSLYLTKGSAIYESGKIGKLSPASVKVDTPKATVGVRGTRFLIEAN
ncbi:MAG: FecR family protein [Pseudoxanthomonas sp.]